MTANKPVRRRERGFFPVILIAFLLLGGLAVMLLWNAVIPSAIPSANKLNYLQAVGLLLLSRILFGGFRRHGPRGRFKEGWGRSALKEKMLNMTDEERVRFREEWRKRCGRDQ